MKNLSSYFECDGCAATPATTTGAGNPSAPDTDNVGSGDTFNFKHKTAKAKRRKKDVKIDDKRAQEQIVSNEGLLDSDFGMDDSYDGVLVGHYLDQYADYFKNYATEQELSKYLQFYNNFETACKGMHKLTAGNTSVMRAFRSKEYTIISFKTKSNLGRRNAGERFVDAIEIRKFIQNPIPEGFEIAYDKDINSVYSVRHRRLNHPSNINMRFWTAYICPGDVYDQLLEIMRSKNIRY